MLSADRPPYETMAALVCHGLFDRFPRMRVATIEAGAAWVPPLLKKLAKAYGQMPWSFVSDPVETFRDHVWVAPVLRGRHGLAEGGSSGWTTCSSVPTGPTPKGLADPRAFAEDLRRHDYTDEEISTVMTENGWPLTRRL